MIKISNSSLLSSATKLLSVLVVAKALSLALLIYLPSDGVDMIQKKNYQPKYQRVDFKNMIDATKKDSASSVTGGTSSSSSSSISITNMVLKGLYGEGEKGFAIVALKKTPKKTSIVGVGESFAGYKLKSISVSGVTFTKLGKEYLLELAKIKSDKSYITRVKKESMNSITPDAYDSGEPRVVTRNDIASYAKNPKQIWKDISIVPLKKGKEIDGFKVTKIKKGSKMALLGLKRGDIIIKANNVELKSYKDALNIYSKIDNIDTIQIVVMRNNIEKELVYEIN